MKSTTLMVVELFQWSISSCLTRSLLNCQIYKHKFFHTMPFCLFNGFKTFDNVSYFIPDIGEYIFPNFSLVFLVYLSILACQYYWFPSSSSFYILFYFSSIFWYLLLYYCHLSECFKFLFLFFDWNVHFLFEIFFCF